MKPPLTATKLRNQLYRLRPDLIVKLKNVRVNGVTFGCSGFVTNPDNGRIVYVNTDHNHHTLTDTMYRLAANHKDYSGGWNRFAEYDQLANHVVSLLEAHEVRELSIRGHL